MSKVNDKPAGLQPASEEEVIGGGSTGSAPKKESKKFSWKVLAIASFLAFIAGLIVGNL